MLEQGNKEEETILSQVHIQEQMYSEEADRQEKTFFRLQNCILLLAVLITILAAFQTIAKQMTWSLAFSVGNVQINLPYILLIALTSLLTLLIAGINRFNPGNKWVRMRTASEAFKREMFHYRTRTGIYHETRLQQNKTTRDTALSQMLEIISKQWVEDNLDYTDLSTFPAIAKPIIKKARKQFAPTFPLSPELSADGYIVERLEDQLGFYRDRSKKLWRKLAWLQWIILGLGATATLLAALQLELIITVTTAASGAIATYLEYRQISNTLKQYNNAIIALMNTRIWWNAQGKEAQKLSETINTLVDRVENILQGEHAGWVQQMQAALTELRDQQEKQGIAFPNKDLAIHNQQDQSKNDAVLNGKPTNDLELKDTTEKP